jgi:hypothetical protein
LEINLALNHFIKAVIRRNLAIPSLFVSEKRVAGFLFVAKLGQEVKRKLRNSNMKCFLTVSIARSEGEKIEEIARKFCIWFIVAKKLWKDND